MPQLKTALALSALALTLYSGIAVAQQTPLPAKTTPAATAPTTTGTKVEVLHDHFNLGPDQGDDPQGMGRGKEKWAMEKVKWQDCNRQSNAEKLTAPKSWSFIGSCMTKS